MAMIFELDVPCEELDQIAAFMREEGEGDIPELGELGTQVMDRLTSLNRGLWHVAVGNFLEYRPTGEVQTSRYFTRDIFVTPDGQRVTGVDYLYDKEGQPTDRVGKVEIDYENPSGAFEIGVPF